MWRSNDNFQKMVEECWQKQIKGCTMYQVVQKLKMLKRELKKLHSKHFSKIMEEVDNLREKLFEVQGRLQLNPMDKEIQKEELETGK